MTNEEIRKWVMGGLTDENEWLELVALEYVLTWNYTDDIERDEKRYKTLSDKKWNHPTRIRILINQKKQS